MSFPPAQPPARLFSLNVGLRRSRRRGEETAREGSTIFSTFNCLLHHIFIHGTIFLFFFFFCFSPIFLTLDWRRCVNIGSLPARERNLPTIQLFERTVMVDVVFVVTNIDKNILWQVKIDCLEM